MTISTLRLLREGRGWSIRDAAQQTGVSSATISRAERRGAMEVKTLIRLCRAYGMNILADDIEQLIRWELPKS